MADKQSEAVALSQGTADQTHDDRDRASAGVPPDRLAGGVPGASLEHLGRYVAIASVVGGYSYLLAWTFYTVLLARFSVSPEQIGIDAASATIRGALAVAVVALFTYVVFTSLGVNRHLRSVAVGLSWRVNTAFLLGIPFTFLLGCWGAYSVLDAAVDGWGWAKVIAVVIANLALTTALLANLLVTTRYGRKAPTSSSSEDLQVASSRSAVAAAVLFGGLVLAVVTGLATIAGDRIERGGAVSFPGVRFPAVQMIEPRIALAGSDPAAVPIPECVIYFGSASDVTILYSLKWGVLRVPSGAAQTFDSGAEEC